jgi:hypothetical protein
MVILVTLAVALQSETIAQQQVDCTVLTITDVDVMLYKYRPERGAPNVYKHRSSGSEKLLAIS